MQFVLLVCLVISIHSGYIPKGDIWVDYANAGYMTTLALSFMLQTPLTSTDYIKMSLPFPLHSSLVPAYPGTEGLSLPHALQITYQYMDNFSNIIEPQCRCQILTQAIDTSIYFIRFYKNDNKTLIQIPNYQWFYIKFTILSTSDTLQFQISNTILQIKIQTVSSVWPNAMIYDDNFVFQHFLLQPPPLPSINLAITPNTYGNNGSNYLIGAQYDIFLDVTLNYSAFQYQLQQKLRLVFLFSQVNTFLFKSNTCISVLKQNPPIINALDSSLYNCTIDKDKNIMTVVLSPIALTRQSVFRFDVNVSNPQIPVSDVTIQVRAMKQFSSVIIANGKGYPALHTDKIYMAYQEIFVGWGLRPDPSLLFDARIFRGNNPTPTYKPYNSISTRFSVSRSTSNNIQLRLQIAIPSQHNAYVLTNAFTHNLPSFPHKQVKCVVEHASDSFNRKIACTGIGSLDSSTVYSVGWKMFFPHDIFESDINCSLFGVISIYTAKMIEPYDNVYRLGRGEDFLNFMKDSPQYYVIGRNISYLSYMLSFPNITLVVRSTDFQQFLERPEQIVITNREIGYINKSFEDVYVVSRNMGFLNYLKNFQDVYVGYQLNQQLDIAKQYNSIPLVGASMPKNTLVIKTSNSKDWTGGASNTQAMISSDTTADALMPTEGLKVSDVNQSLIISIQAPYSDVTNALQNSSTITDNWGMLIMMSSKITPSENQIVLTSASSSLNATVLTVSSPLAYNNYTLIVIRGSTPSALQTTFPIPPTRTVFSVYPFLINDFSSIFVDDTNFDIMIATVDGIDGPLNKMKYTSYFLINGFTLMNSSIVNSFNFGYVANCGIQPMDGSKVPTILRINGSITNGRNLSKIVVFFDQLQPYFQNQYTGQLYCQTSDNVQNVCRFIKGAQEQMLNYDFINYLTFSRIQTQITNPNKQFDILIPIKTIEGKLQTYFYLGYTAIDPISGLQQLSYISPITSIINLVSPYSVVDNYGPDLSAAIIGEQLSPLNIEASSSISINVNNNSNIGGAFLYFSQWDYFSNGNASISGWSNGPCYILYYLLYQSNYGQFISSTQPIFNYTYKNMGGVVCFTDTNNSITSSVITVSPSSPPLPSKWGLNLPGYGAYSQNDGNLLTLNTNSMLIPSSIQISNTSVITPTMGPNLNQYLGVWTITLPTDISDDIMITINTKNGVNLPFNSPSGVCTIYVLDFKVPIICNYVFNLTNIYYVLTINQTSLLTNGTSLSIYHYGLSTNSTYNSIQFSLKCYSLYTSRLPTPNQLIFFADNLLFPYGVDDVTYLGPSQIILGSYKQKINNKGAITSFSFSFNVISKGLYVTQRIKINLGQYYIDNNVTKLDAQCKIYQFLGSIQSNLYSHDWAAVDSSQGFNKLQFWPKNEISNDNITYTIKCFNFVTTSAIIPQGISAKVVNTSADLVGDISTLSSLTIIPLPDLPLNTTISVTKKYNIPSFAMELSLVIVSPGITTESIMYVGFPAFYSSGLGQAINCYSTYEIFCYAENRKLVIRYIGNFEKGITFVMTVTGIEMPINMGIGTFWYVIDNDNNLTTVLSSGTFADNTNPGINPNLVTVIPALQILQLNLSSYYIRDNCILTLDFYLPSTLSTTINVGQFVLLTFPASYQDILRFATPKCSINIRNNTAKNFISSCSVYGMNIKMPILISMPLGSAYTLKISGLINPSNPSPNTYKYVLSITTLNNNSIMIRSFSPHCNFDWLVFLLNPISISLNFYTASHGLITQLSTYINIQSQPVYISDSASYNTSQYDRNVYLMPYINVQTNPSTLTLLSGMNPFPIRLSSMKNGVNFIYFTKTGDGNYYSNLPPLILLVNVNYVLALQFVESQQFLPVAEVGASYKIGLNLPSQLYPMSQVTLNASLPTNFQGLTLIGTQAIQVSSSQTIVFVTLIINDVTQWIVGTSVTLTISPINNNTYFGAANITLTAVSYLSTIPNTIMSLNSSDYKVVGFDITCSQYGYFVYHVSRQYSYNLTACSLTREQIQFWVQQRSLDSLRSSQLYYKCQDVIGLVNILSPNQLQLLTINSLSASTSYTIQGYCSSNLVNSQSELETLSFTTALNGGFVSKIDIYFDHKLTVQESIKAVCALALLIGMQYQMVSTVQGYYCSDLLSGRLLLQQLPISDHQQLKQQPSDNQPYNRLLLTSSFRKAIYFGVNTKLVNDSTQAIIHALSVSQIQIISIHARYIGQLSNVVRLDQVVYVTQSNATYIGNNYIINESIFVDVGPTYVYVQGITMPNDGIIYIMIGEDALWKTDPVISEIKRGSGPNGLPPRFFKVLGYRTSEINSSYAAFVGIGYSRLRMYILVSDDNPFDTAIFGEIRKYVIEPEKPNYWMNLTLSVFVWIIFFTAF